MSLGAISVKVDGGAVGDGVTDDTAAFRTCALIGGAILVPEGTYIVDWVDLAADCEWIGEGAGSIIKKKANSVGTSLLDDESFLFNVTDADITVGFTGLVLDGNYTGQAATNTGAVPANVSATNNYNANATVMAAGGAIRTNGAVPVSSSERLVVRVSGCTIRNCVLFGILFQSQVDVGATAELIVTDTLFHTLGPGVAAYGDGTGDRPAVGYSWAVNGATPNHILVMDAAKATVTGCTFLDSRDPTAGTLTTGYALNCYNLPGTGIRVTIWETDASTPEWSSISVSGCRFHGLGRGGSASNGLGVIDMYARAGEATITGNRFTDCRGTGIRGKTNARNLAISGNVIVGHATAAQLDSGGGIEVVAETLVARKGDYAITGNVIKTVAQGIVVSSNPTLVSGDTDPDTRVNNIVISDNVIEDVTNAYYANSGLRSILTVYGWGIAVRYAADVTVSGNVVRNTDTVTGGGVTEYGIIVRDCIDGVSIVGNIVNETAYKGILAGTNVGALDISHNQVRDANSDAIGVTTHTGVVTVIGNQVDTAAGKGISISNTGPVTLADNHIRTTTDTGILAGSSATTAIVATGNTVESVAADTAGTIYGLTTSTMTSGTISLVGNRIASVVNAGAGNAHGIHAAFASVADTSTAVIEGNTISSTDQAGLFLDDVTGTITGNVFKSCNTGGSTSYGAIFVNGTGNSGIIHVVGNTVDASTAPFPTAGGGAGSTIRGARLVHEIGNSWQAVNVDGTGAPASGTWAVGDIVWNTTPTSGGNIGWVCTTAGTPGTWKTFGTIA